MSTAAITKLERAMLYLRKTYRVTRRGNYTPKQIWFGACNRWKDRNARNAYYVLYDLICLLKGNPSHRKNRKF